jgi:hypothetical protein
LADSPASACQNLRANLDGRLYSEQMHEQPQIEIPGGERPARGPFSFALMVAAAGAVIVLAGFYLWPGRQSPSRGDAKSVQLPFGPEERSYAAQIVIENLALSRAENFLNQEVTILTGQLNNSGQRTVREVELSVEFYDDMNQIALRESRLALISAGLPLGPTERRPFEVSFEHIPTSWNMQQPVVHISGLLFASSK